MYNQMIALSLRSAPRPDWASTSGVAPVDWFDKLEDGTRTRRGHSLCESVPGSGCLDTVNA